MLTICGFAMLPQKIEAALLQYKSLATNQIQLTWQSTSNLSEELQHSTNLSSWQIVMRPYPAQVTNSILTNVLATALPKEFFRLQFSALTNTPVPTTPGMYLGLKLVSGGLTRTYRLYIPPSYSSTNFLPSPLAVILHGGGQTADSFAGLHPDLFNNAGSNNMILVLPDSTHRDDTTSWMFNVPRPYEAQVNDTQFILDLVNVLKCALYVDNLRVYAGGFSNGGQMVHQLGITTTNTFAALASVESTIAGSQGTNPIVLPGPSLEPYPILIVNATNDCTRPYYGGVNTEGSLQSPAFAAANYWVTNNGCTTNAVTYFVTNVVTNYQSVGHFQTECYPRAVTNGLVTNTAVLARFTSCGIAK
ncbi:MAG: PHB depolymerase family esterase, partial [Verrucomicrobiota bacterium]